MGWFPTPGDFPDPGNEPTFLVAPALAGGFYHCATGEVYWSFLKILLFKFKDNLKVKEWKMIYHTYNKHNETGMTY